MEVFGGGEVNRGGGGEQGEVAHHRGERIELLRVSATGRRQKKWCGRG
jgi:hypothetical protein